ncbi:MAG: tRNA (N(6)-L-threonylcarbamoyladenosine(37)-C(2))-methylthiotransferase MtaB [Bacteroidales bacterium]|jgi:threonylcarbamoyladenosine tRNA methylthiotransferase MtaB|nr:tRNA (N(6)-L-threonylcarbamoyladenosine(37)-C(2))-methylthiotransferase MtaB [Bacteroidales bacterium]
MRIAFYTLGCKLNFAESSSLATQAAERGHNVVEFQDKADIYVINTCTVTAQAEKKCRQTISRAARFGGKVVVMGCFSQLRPDTVKQIEGVSYVFGTADRERLFDILDEPVANSGIRASVASAEVVAARPAAITDITANADCSNSDTTSTVAHFTPLYSTTGRTRAFFKIQDGCNNFCAYCAVPYARGRSRSASIARTVEVAKQIANDGIKEVIFTGVNIGDFGRSNSATGNNRETLAQLIRALLPIEGIERYRISSIEPDLLTEEIIELAAKEKKIMPHFHIPLQSGSNTILQDMKRHYKRELFAEKVHSIKGKIPHAFIAADIIVGFPTETNELFEETYQFLNDLPISALHVFTYSPRPEAASFKISSLNTPKERKQRSDKLLALSNKKKEEFYLKFVGQGMSVLWEGDNNKHSEFMQGYTENYLRVKMPYNRDKINTIENINITKLNIFI